jgi:restriction endonuclease S subunit
MKNTIKIAIGLLFSIGIITSCNKTDEVLQSTNIKEVKYLSEAESEQFLQENIAVYDARIRSLSEDAFVREVYLKNFSDKSWDKTSIGFTGYLFEDNGKGNDLIANDGIYTSVEIFIYDDVIKYDENMDIRSVMSKPIVSPDFIQEEALQDYSTKYDVRPQSLKAGGTATLTCKVKICSTGCIADWIWDGFGCICVSDCSATIGW